MIAVKRTPSWEVEIVRPDYAAATYRPAEVVAMFVSRNCLKAFPSSIRFLSVKPQEM